VTASIEIRKTKKEDIPALVDITVRSIKEICAKDYPGVDLSFWLENKTPEAFTGMLSSKEHTMFTGHVNQKIMGIGLVGHDGWIRLCYLVPEALGLGLGRALMMTMLEVLQRLGVIRAQLESTRTALEFYKQLGFKAEKKVICQDTCHVEAIYMTKEL